MGLTRLLRPSSNVSSSQMASLADGMGIPMLDLSRELGVGRYPICGKELHQTLQRLKVDPQFNSFISNHRQEHVVRKSAITPKLMPELIHRSVQ